MGEADNAAMPARTIYYRIGPPINDLDIVREQHQSQVVGTPDDHEIVTCRTCYMFDESWPCAVARLVAIIDEQIEADRPVVNRMLRPVFDERIREHGTDQLPSTAEAAAEALGIPSVDLLAIRTAPQPVEPLAVLDMWHDIVGIGVAPVLRDETVWLIERGQPERQVPTVWWADEHRWTSDANKAFKFSSRAAAQEVIGLRLTPPQARYGGASARAVEHAFVNPTPAPERRQLADNLIDAVEDALQSEALPDDIHGCLQRAYDDVVEEANR